MKICGFLASVANGKLKQEAQTKISDAMQAMSVLYMAHLEVILQHQQVLWMRSGLRVSSTPIFALRI